MSEERLRELEDRYEGFKVYDNQGEKIGKVDDLFVDETGREEYVGVKMGLLGLRSALIPMDIVRVDEADKTIEVSESKDGIRDAPTFDDDDDITPEYEDRIRSHFGLESLNATDMGSYGAYPGDTPAREEEEDRAETGERAEVETSGESEGHERRPDPETYPEDTGREEIAEPLPETHGEEGRETAAEYRPEETGAHERGNGRTRVRRRVTIEEEYDEEPEPR